MASLRCTRCFRTPIEGRKPEEAFEGICSLGFAKFSPTRFPKREVIHLLCHRRWWTSHPDVPKLDLYSLRLDRVFPKGTRLDLLGN